MPLVILEMAKVPPIVWAPDRNGNASALGASPALSRPLFSKVASLSLPRSYPPTRTLESRAAAEHVDLKLGGSCGNASPLKMIFAVPLLLSKIFVVLMSPLEIFRLN